MTQLTTFSELHSAKIAGAENEHKSRENSSSSGKCECYTPIALCVGHVGLAPTILYTNWSIHTPIYFQICLDEESNPQPPGEQVSVLATTLTWVQAYAVLYVKIFGQISLVCLDQM